MTLSRAGYFWKLDFALVRYSEDIKKQSHQHRSIETKALLLKSRQTFQVLGIMQSLLPIKSICNQEILSRTVPGETIDQLDKVYLCSISELLGRIHLL